MDESSAAERARTYGAENLPDLGVREWKGTAFAGGWLMTAAGDDIAWNTGVICLIVLDDGTIHEESSSLPPSMVMDRYRTDL